MNSIEHVVVVMMENRSFDNLLGWLYDNQTDPPPFNIPSQTPATFEGLLAGAYSNALNGSAIYARAGLDGLAMPGRQLPAWCRLRTRMSNSCTSLTSSMAIFGTGARRRDMVGFLADYALTDAGAAAAGQIMQSFGPPEANVINALARNFAVCDRWFSSVPAQTWPNRGFVHTGSSDGHINNDDYELYDIPTIFNVLEEQGKSWGVFSDTTLIPSLTLGQFSPQLLPHADRFHQFKMFKALCAGHSTAPPARKLPDYSFVEPRFVTELGLFKIDYPSDYHPPHDIGRGEIFLADVYQAVRTSPYRDKILLVITFDEHGGCYDHVPPPGGAAPPQPWPVSPRRAVRFQPFRSAFRRSCISSYVPAGDSLPDPRPMNRRTITRRFWPRCGTGCSSTVIRPGSPSLPSPRIKAAPTLDRVLTLNDANKNTNWPDIVPQGVVGTDDTSFDTPLNDVQKSLLASALQAAGQGPASGGSRRAPSVVSDSKPSRRLRSELPAPPRKPSRSRRTTMHLISCIRQCRSVRMNHRPAIVGAGNDQFRWGNQRFFFGHAAAGLAIAGCSVLRRFSRNGARMTPRSVMKAAIRFAGVTSNAGLWTSIPSGAGCRPKPCSDFARQVAVLDRDLGRSEPIAKSNVVVGAAT